MLAGTARRQPQAEPRILSLAELVHPLPRWASSGERVHRSQQAVSAVLTDSPADDAMSSTAVAAYPTDRKAGEW
jgi:hypothetical protein